MASKYINNKDLEELIGPAMDDIIEMCAHVHIPWDRMRWMLVRKWLEAEQEKNTRFW